MAEHDAVVGIYNSHTEAEASIKELQRTGFDMQKLSILGKDYPPEEHALDYYNVGDRIKVWGKLGAFWGGLWGWPFGSTLFYFMPGVGRLVVLGPLAGWIVGAVEGAVVVGGLSVLGAALYSIGIPQNGIVQYETALQSDKYLVIAHGTADEVARSRSILEMSGATHIAIHPSICGEVAG